MKPAHPWKILALAAWLFAQSGCASNSVGPRRSASESLVVIHLDLSRSPSYWRKVPLLCDDGRGGRPWWNMHTDGKGLFFQEGAPPGRCWITGGFQDGIVTRIYKLPETADRNPTTTVIKGPGVHYMGSYRFEPSGDDFRLVRTNAVGERDALRRLLPWTAGTDWERVVSAKL
jgi:hypothetical protein